MGARKWAQQLSVPQAAGRAEEDREGLSCQKLEKRMDWLSKEGSAK